MNHILEHIIVTLFNRRHSRHRRTPSGLLLGHTVAMDGGAEAAITVPHSKRAEHMAILGRTGTGKSSLLRVMSTQDVRADRGFVHIDLHAETTAFMLALLASEERRRSTDLSGRVIVLEPADSDWALGINVLEAQGERECFLQVAEITRILKQRWQLDTFGARTEELLRNSLLALAESGLTLVDLPMFLTDAAFRQRTLNTTTNVEVLMYFAQRFNIASDAFQQTWREPVLNKITALTADPQLRLMLGQARSTVSLVDALDRGCFVLLNLDKARLGEQAATLGSLFFTKLKNAIFARRSRRPVTIYADELQNLVTYDADLESVLSEARKFGCGVCTANQYLDQYPATLRAAILAIGTHVLFQVSAPDADKLGSLIGGGKPLQTLLKNLPPRQFVVKTGHHEWQHGRVPPVEEIRTDPTDLYNRCRRRWARPRAQVEAEIRQRQHVARPTEVLDGWE
jgi:hypothetical protein